MEATQERLTPQTAARAVDGLINAVRGGFSAVHSKYGQARSMETDDVSEFIRERYESREYWIVCLDKTGFALLGEVERRYYTGEAAADIDVFLVGLEGELFMYAVARKRRMQSDQFCSLLRQMTRTKASRRRWFGQDVFVSTRFESIEQAMCMTLMLIRDTATARVCVYPIDD